MRSSSIAVSIVVKLKNFVYRSVISLKFQTQMLRILITPLSCSL